MTKVKRIEVAKGGELTTIAIVICNNGAEFLGYVQCQEPKQYDHKRAERLATVKALEKMAKYEAYLNREKF